MAAKRPEVIAVYKDLNTLETAVAQLKGAGFTQDEISVIVPHKADDAPKSTGGAGIGAGTGAMLGGTLGWLVGAGLLAVPGLGALIVAGPIGTALLGSVALGGVGGIVGSFAGLGLNDKQARAYEARLKRGEPVLSVQCDNPERAKKIHEILQETGAEDVFSQQFNSFIQEDAQVAAR